MKTRIHEWHSIKTGATAYGVQVKPEGRRRFHHASADVRGVNRGLIYKTKERAQEVAKQFEAGKLTNYAAGLVPLINRRKS